MRSLLQDDDIQNPENIMSRMVRDYIEGRLGDAPRVLFRASVVAIDYQGGQFETDPANPRGSVRARIITNSYNAATDVEDLPVFWPLHPFNLMPIKEREHIYVIFEDEDRTHGLWIGRVSQPLDFDSKNFVDGVDPYIAKTANHVNRLTADQIVSQAYAPIPNVQPSPDFMREQVPEFTAMVGDYIMPGSNNTLIVLGRDRPGGGRPAQPSNAGTIDVVVGRAGTEPDTLQDKTRVYVSNNTAVDLNFGTQTVGSVTPEVPPPGPAAAIISDEVRIVGRNGMKIVVKNGTITIDGTTINIGTAATEPAVLGTELNTFLTKLLTAIGKLVINPTSYTVTPDSLLAVSDLAATLPSLLSTSVKVKQ